MKRVEEIFFRTLMYGAVLVITGLLFLIIYSIISKGASSLSWEMVSQTPRGGYYFGKEGGILNAIIGSLYLSAGATALAFFISLPVALGMNIYLAKYRRMVNGLRFILDLLWGVPSIVYGAFAFSIMIMVGARASLMAGIITVGVFIVPIMIRAMDEVFKTVPRGLTESALSLGATFTETSFGVLVRQCAPGVVTALLLGFGRGIGDAAAVLFTTGYTDYIPGSLSQPAATLPLAIFFQLGSPIEEVRERAFAAALLLTLIILLISVITRILSNRFNKNRINF
ncbi:MAG: ABC transporter permease subunit [Bacteroidetes bacterium]|nr:ABC transporter permease subunit [Bacteroidota bacterium]MBU1717879.1 ABC transporter permease subunit [Bacteroidota bacterium]